jgi:outer membrane protein TolC
MRTFIAKTLHLGALLVLTTGCAVGPDYVRPETSTADTWFESADSALSTESADYGPWWGVFTDSVTDASHSVELALVQYRQGSVTYQRVLDTQRFRVRQEDQLAGTKGDVALNLVATYKALGGGWATEQSEGATQ